MKERIRQLIDYYGLNVYNFEKKISVSEGTIRNFIKTNSSLRSDVLQKIHDYFPNVSIDWLLTGEGSMIRTQSAPHGVNNKVAEPQVHYASSLDQSAHTLPLIPFGAVAGLPPAVDNFGATFSDCEQYIVPDFIARGADFVIRVDGDSMLPTFSPGDILACRLVRDVRLLQWGKTYVIDTSEGALVKRIFQPDDKETINLISDNKDHYPPISIPADAVRSFSLVVGLIRSV